MESIGKSYANGLSANMEFKKEKGKVWFHIRPSFRYTRTDSFTKDSTETWRKGSFLNRSQNSSQNLSSDKNASLSTNITFRELWGKNNRSIQLYLYSSYAGNNGESM